ncbi:MAG: aminodeoxyfutalosine deaminase [Frankiales bacterium]|jgi:cytosine/adenosine deaminase-related metal-dependent hydrolase|nr:aminodeoxyfutalosine deaminase [Frankiales bacterium]
MAGVLTVHTADVVLPIVSEAIPDGAVLVDGASIAAIGPRDDVLAAHPAARVREHRGVLTPGLVNAHAHLQYTDFADLASTGKPFPEWIAMVAARRSTFDDAAWQSSARRGIHLALSSGTTAVADIVTDPAVLPTLARSGLAGTAYLEALFLDSAGWAARGSGFADLLVQPGGPNAVGVSPHTLYTLGTEVFQDLLRLARDKGLRTHTHLAESAAEAEYVLTGTGPFADFAARFAMDFELIGAGAGVSPARHLADLGGLGPDVHVAHGVHLDAADRLLLRQSGTYVALCVRSNAILKAGEPPVADYLREGNPFGIGTDSLASSPSLDLLEEAAATRAVALAQGYVADDLDRRLVEALTLGGAGAMGLSDAGRLAVGVRADLAVFDVSTAGDPYTALLDHGAGTCTATVLGGRLVHRSAAEETV